MILSLVFYVLIESSAYDENLIGYDLQILFLLSLTSLELFEVCLFD